MTTTMATESPQGTFVERRRPARVWWRVAIGALAGLTLALGSLAGCGGPAAEPAAGSHGAHSSEDESESWAVTAWGERFEIFPEVEPLIAGQVAVAHTHVTVLDGFTPLQDGSVEIVLAGASGEQSFLSSEPSRPGIFAVEIEPSVAGDYELLFRIEDGRGTEEIRGGRVRVGTREEPGGIRVAPAPRGATSGGEPVSFLKEEQWRSDFGTQWVRRGRLPRAVAGLARLRPPAGGERVITAPVDGMVQAPAESHRWPFEGMAVRQGEALLQLLPQIAPERSLAALEADLHSLTAELETARARSSRLEELLALEATSRREVEEARTRLETLEARHVAAAQDLEAARAARAGERSGGSTGIDLRAPWKGAVAQVLVAPGSTVAAGEPLARVVRTDRVWIEVALAPAAAALLADSEVRGVVLSDPQGAPMRLEEGVRLVSIAPEVSPRNGTVAALVEAPAGGRLALGATLEASILTAETLEGVVIPASAVVDDGGVSVVYLQLGGETFVRQPVRVEERQGDELLVDALMAGQRLVNRGGAAIRRSSLMAGGEAHGHVH
ncbi:MAG: efflux RND transporter periplasmic adaptor subunit [Acidobacteriota bacterium]|nr:efflux RND transporter periplasmic adaptor subunit [Acidobacteriota bacterium]